jgi:hypothetical protein
VFNVLDSDADEAGRVWFASLHEAAVDTTTARGIYRFDPASGVWTHCYPGDSDGDGVPESPDSSLMVSSKVNAVEVEGGYLWIGYYNDGLSRCRLDEDGLPTDRESDWEHFTMDASTGAHLFSNGVRALASRPGEVWIGTTGGLTLWTPTLWKRFETQPTGEVTDIALTDDGAAWVGIRQKGVTRVTREGGLYRYQRFEPPWLVNPTPTAMIAGADGDDVWIGTEAGLSHFVPGGAVGEGPTDRIQVFPNPYNPACPTPLSLLSVPGRAYEGTICDVAGQVVARFREAWSGDAIWNGRDLDGRVVPPGLYVIRATTPRGWLTGKVAVLDLPCVP